MADDEKAKLFKRLYSASLHAVLERMRVHGFWPTGVDLPAPPPEATKERARIAQELAELQSLSGAVADPQAALRQERVRRWQASKARRATNRAAVLAKLKAAREAYAAYRKTTIVHAGVGVSARLQDVGGDASRLLTRGLPVIQSAPELAQALSLSLSRLRWLTFHRRAAVLVHYHRFGITKKTGGVRNISAPKPELARAQRWVLDHVLSKLTTEAEAHGFVPGRSVVTNALPHVGRQVVINVDLKDFFPTITFRRVRGLFEKLGYNGQVATLLALLCTEPPRVPAEVDGQLYYVALSARRLPQGACTSPAITNAICRKLDRRLAGLAKRHHAGFTRYADDLTFSFDEQAAVGPLLKSVRTIVSLEGFTEHEDKTRVMRQGRRQEVTGVSVNTRLSVPRDEWRELRAILHNAKKHGLESQNRAQHPHFAAYLRGRIAWVHMVDPARAAKLKAAFDALKP
jgi:retron-type reverse transcriptase